MAQISRVVLEDEILAKTHPKLRYKAMIFWLDLHGLFILRQLHETRVKQSERDKLAILEKRHNIRR
jgi:hypothetical protein